MHVNTPPDATIEDVLWKLGIRRGYLDEFETVGLGEHRSQPAYLAKYRKRG